jgi:choline kinase
VSIGCRPQIRVRKGWRQRLETPARHRHATSAHPDPRRRTRQPSGDLGVERPKWLLEVRGRTLADRQLDAFRRAADLIGGDKVSIQAVGGHAADAIEQFLREQSPPRPSLIHNPEFARLNNWYSLHLALRDLPEDPGRVVVCNGDLLADQGWMAQFVVDSAGTDAQALIAVDLSRELTTESMKVSAHRDDPGRMMLEHIGKVGVQDAVGEYVGMLMARGDALRRLRDELSRLIGNSAAAEWYERAVGHTAQAGTPWTLWPAPDGRWVEIDDDCDYRAAVELAGSAPAS